MFNETTNTGYIEENDTMSRTQCANPLICKTITVDFKTVPEPINYTTILVNVKELNDKIKHWDYNND